MKQRKLFIVYCQGRELYFIFSLDSSPFMKIQKILGKIEYSNIINKIYISDETFLGYTALKRAKNITVNRTQLKYGACAMTQISRPLSNFHRGAPCFHSHYKLGQRIYETDAQIY